VEVVLFGVDKVPFPGFHFQAGGVETFLEAISSEMVLHNLGSKLTARGEKDTTFMVVHQDGSQGAGQISSSTRHVLLLLLSALLPACPTFWCGVAGAVRGQGFAGASSVRWRGFLGCQMCKSHG
jgi:hypothetical protein